MKKFFLIFSAAVLVFACQKPGNDADSTKPGTNPGGKVEEEVAAVEVNMVSGGNDQVVIRSKNEDVTATLKAILDGETEAEAVINIEVDRSYIASAGGTLLPANYYELEDDCFVIAEGEDNAELDIEFKITEMPVGKTYVLPLVVEPESEFVEVGSQSRVVFTVTHAPNKEIEMIACPEVNNVNPLNYGEVILEDGTPFFDYVVLFAYNINYNSSEDRVYLHSNPNCQALLDDSQIYLQPLREKGIKVLMGLLGNHDASGLCQLSDWGAQQFAAEVATAIKQYGMDGVFLDDEYSNAPGSGKWFAPRSAAAGSRLCYELKKAMKEAKCDNNVVSIFNWGSLYTMPSVDGVDPSEFIDQCIANYGSTGTLSGNMTKKWASGISCECNRNSYASASAAKQAMDNGYGFIFYFNPDPALKRAYYGEDGYFSQAAQGVYNQKCKPMTQWWKKTGEGKYDPNPYTW